MRASGGQETDSVQAVTEGDGEADVAERKPSALASLHGATHATTEARAARPSRHRT